MSKTPFRKRILKVVSLTGFNGHQQEGRRIAMMGFVTNPFGKLSNRMFYSPQSLMEKSFAFLMNTKGLGQQSPEQEL